MEGEKSFSGARLVEGKLVIPESRRKDGSVRQKLQVRPGYIAPEDTPRYRPGSGGLAFLENQMRKLKLENESKDDKRKQQENSEKKSTISVDEKGRKSEEIVKGTMESTEKEDVRPIKDQALPRPTEAKKNKEMRNFEKNSLKTSSKSMTPEWRRSARPFHQEGSEKSSKPRAADDHPRTSKGKLKQRNEEQYSKKERSFRGAGNK
ncbi:mago binding protein [Schizosaccharomyces octosporus yFS286]|uniref:Mago binding protein n=1 Tax=Schizosaccharomyces octosporus (strain yFS286) TaxID=483514 RepID=S9PMH2_SCHOY|nr:mago binding protein [Schizosaccharomyces octosporus yFS286]EPX70461.1 mago binding protein [Schizosaccharomyces octosporus yFS286]